MLCEDYTQEFLELKGVILKKVENINNAKYFHLELIKGVHPCPVCGKLTSKVHDYRYQPVKDALLIRSKTILYIKKRRYVCPDCGKRFYESLDFLPKYYRMTNRLAASVVDEFRHIQSIKSIARRYNISTTTTSRILDYVSYPISHLPEVLSIDEFKGNAGGNKFQCILTDAKNKRILDILPSRKTEDLYSYFSKFKDRRNVKYVVIDMSHTYRDLAKSCFKDAKIVADKYHVVRQVTWAFEKVRKEVQKDFYKNRRIYFKRSRRLLLKRACKLTENESEQLESMLMLSERLREAYNIKEKFYDFMKSTSITEARARMLEWNLYVGASKYDDFQKCFDTFRRWDKYILNAFDCPYTNGYTEGVNNKIKVLKRTSFGVRNFERFRNRILHMMAA